MLFRSANEPEEPEETAKAFLEILASSKKPLYEGAKLSVLDAISQLMAVKAEYGCRRGCFEAFLGVWANSLAEGYELPKTMYVITHKIRGSRQFSRVDYSSQIY